MEIRILIIMLLLSGCNSQLVGNWSGKIGPFVGSFKLQPDGTGKLCYSRGNVNKIEVVKYNSSAISTERDYIAVINSVSDNVLEFEVDADGVKEYTFTRDKHLKNTSWFCWKKLHSG
jgi:hypothetical protein